MTSPRVVIVNTSRSWGGNEHWAVAVGRGLAARGWRVRFVWSHPAVGERVRAAGLAGARVRLRGDLDLRGLLALRAELRRAGADAVLLTKWREYLLGGLAARLVRPRPRVVLGLGLRVVPRDDWKRRLVFRLADQVLVNAPEIRDALATRPWIPTAKVAVVVNGVDLARWRPRWEPERAAAGRAQRAAWGVPPEAPLVVNVGNLTPQKDHRTLVAACALLRAQRPDLRVAILGEGPLRADLERDLRERGLAGVVTLAGFAADPGDALAAADLFVLSSDNEGMAFVLMEAAASGLPAVTTDVSGARFCVRDGETGRVVPPRDPAALAAAMGEMLADRSALALMGRRARALAECRLDEARMVAETAAVLRADRAAGR